MFGAGARAKESERKCLVMEGGRGLEISKAGYRQTSCMG